MKEASHFQQFDDKTCKKIVFIYNAIEKGWTVKKYKDSYIFKKKHNNQKKVFEESYLYNFIKENFNLVE